MPSSRIMNYDVEIVIENKTLYINYNVFKKCGTSYERFTISYELFKDRKTLIQERKEVCDNFTFSFDYNDYIITIENDIEDVCFHIVCYNKYTDVITSDRNYYLEENSEKNTFLLKNTKY